MHRYIPHRWPQFFRDRQRVLYELGRLRISRSTTESCVAPDRAAQMFCGTC
jgi:hypothetical protein